jgi:hypothetical protein
MTLSLLGTSDSTHRFFFQNIAEVVRNAISHHRFAHVMSFSPYRVLNTSLILDGVFFSLLLVVVLCAATMTSKSLVETYMGWITLLKRTEQGWLFRWNHLVFEIFGCSKSHKVGIEGSMLKNSEFERLASI